MNGIAKQLIESFGIMEDDHGDYVPSQDEINQSAAAPVAPGTNGHPIFTASPQKIARFKQLLAKAQAANAPAPVPPKKIPPTAGTSTQATPKIDVTQWTVTNTGSGQEVTDNQAKLDIIQHPNDYPTMSAVKKSGTSTPAAPVKQPEQPLVAPQADVPDIANKTTAPPATPQPNDKQQADDGQSSQSTPVSNLPPDMQDKLNKIIDKLNASMEN